MSRKNSGFPGLKNHTLPSSLLKVATDDILGRKLKDAKLLVRERASKKQVKGKEQQLV